MLSKVYLFFAFYSTIFLVRGVFVKNVVMQDANIIGDLFYRDFYEVAESYHLEHNELLGIIDAHIQTCGKKEARKLKTILEQHRIVNSFHARKYGIITDTHSGNPSYENWNKVKAAYNFFGEHNIYIVLHLGDFFEGYGNRKMPEKEKEKIQHSRIESFQKNFPNGFKTYVLLGNHDEELFSPQFNLYDEMRNARDDIAVMGAGGCFISCLGNIFYLYHPVQAISHPFLSNYPVALKLSGHAHYFKYDERGKCFTIAACGDAMGYSGFATLFVEEYGVTLNGYSFEDKGIKRKISLEI